ncbi:MAG TPA: SpoIIE family protein phosphatase [Victivallales bacterium]|nr:SpoIIE family protein phosphatase [Victivallales bacterium]
MPLLHKKPIGLRKRIILSYILLICIVGTLFSVIHFLTSLKQTSKQTSEAVKSIRELEDANFKHQVEILRPLVKQYVFDNVYNVAQRISRIISRDKLDTLKQVEQNRLLREIAIQPIIIHNVSVGHMALINKSGDIVFNPDKNMENSNIKDYIFSKRKLFEIYENAIKSNIYSGSSIIEIPDGDSTEKEIYRYWLFIHVPGTDYYIYGTVSINNYLDPIMIKIKEREKFEINDLNKQINKEFYQTWLIISLIFLLAFLILFLVSIIIGLWLSGVLVKPIITLKDAAIKMGEGNFDVEVEEYGSIETIQLAKTFNQLGSNLKNYLIKLEKEIVAREQIEGELDIARKIQKSILPHLTSEFIRSEFSIVVDLIPAKEVAGDFYDFFYINDEQTKLAVLIGDVSGKGVPAAFFMGILKTIAKNMCKYETDNPGKALNYINNAVCSENKEKMFASIFLLYYDIPTGNFKYANAGHHNAIILNREKNTIREFGILGDVLVGFFDDVEYGFETDHLEPGEKMILYTDGITEAFSGRNEFYGEERLQKILINNSDEPVEKLWEKVIDDVMEFQKNVLFDDITLCVFKRSDDV